jgi:hypothetical protein
MAEFDFRKLNPKEGDLILLVDDDMETGNFPLLLSFRKFLSEEHDDSGLIINLLGNNKCSFEAIEAIYLLPQRYFFKDQFRLTRPEEVKEDVIKYCADRGYKGVADISDSLRHMEGHNAYADLLSVQSRPHQRH